jgi:hypothetical protein
MLIWEEKQDEYLDYLLQMTNNNKDKYDIVFNVITDIGFVNLLAIYCTPGKKFGADNFRSIVKEFGIDPFSILCLYRLFESIRAKTSFVINSLQLETAAISSPNGMTSSARTTPTKAMTVSF